MTGHLRCLRIQALRCLDLSQLTKRVRKDVGPESVVLLAEILSRLEIKRQIKKEGIKFAYPTTTTYLAQED